MKMLLVLIDCIMKLIPPPLTAALWQHNKGVMKPLWHISALQ